VPAKPETMHRIGTLSQTFTSLMAMEFVNQNFLDMDTQVFAAGILADVSEFFPYTN